MADAQKALEEQIAAIVAKAAADMDAAKAAVSAEFGSNKQLQDLKDLKAKTSRSPPLPTLQRQTKSRSLTSPSRSKP